MILSAFKSMIAKLLHATWCLAIILWAWFSLGSCSEEHVPMVEEPLPVYSYFRGYINDEYICIEQNTAYDKRIDYTSTLGLKGKILTYGWRMIFIDDYNASFKHAPSLSVQLAPLALGRYNIKGARFHNIESAIALATDKNQYVPNPSHPFKISLGKLVETPPYGGAPFIAGAMEGILYNRDNPTDSLIIRDATFCLVTSGFK